MPFALCFAHYVIFSSPTPPCLLDSSQWPPCFSSNISHRYMSQDIRISCSLCLEFSSSRCPHGQLSSPSSLCSEATFSVRANLCFLFKLSLLPTLLTLLTLLYVVHLSHHLSSSSTLCHLLIYSVLLTVSPSWAVSSTKPKIFMWFAQRFSPTVQNNDRLGEALNKYLLSKGKLFSFLSSSIIAFFHPSMEVPLHPQSNTSSLVLFLLSTKCNQSCLRL